VKFVCPAVARARCCFVYGYVLLGLYTAFISQTACPAVGDMLCCNPEIPAARQQHELSLTKPIAACNSLAACPAVCNIALYLTEPTNGSHARYLQAVTRPGCARNTLWRYTTGWHCACETSSSTLAERHSVTPYPSTQGCKCTFAQHPDYRHQAIATIVATSRFQGLNPTIRLAVPRCCCCAAPDDA
jgi:hypothetical protein